MKSTDPISLFQETVAVSPDRNVSGVRALWLKVIIRAVFDWVSYRDATKLEKLKYAQTAYTWLFEPSVLFNSFENLCESLDVEPGTVRKWARGLTKEQVAKIEHLERESWKSVEADEWP